MTLEVRVARELRAGGLGWGAGDGKVGGLFPAVRQQGKALW